MAASLGPLDRQQPKLACRSSGRQEGVEVRHALVERKRPAIANGHHADEALPAQADHIRVLVVKAIDEASRLLRPIAGDFFDKRPVVERVYLVKLPRLAGDLHLEGSVHEPLEKTIPFRGVVLHAWVL